MKIMLLMALFTLQDDPVFVPENFVLRIADLRNSINFIKYDRT